MDERVLIGGNHLAHVLGLWLGPDFPERYPPTMDVEEARKHLGGIDHDLWVCWRAIMLARDESKSGGVSAIKDAWEHFQGEFLKAADLDDQNDCFVITGGQFARVCRIMHAAIAAEVHKPVHGPREGMTCARCHEPLNGSGCTEDAGVHWYHLYCLDKPQSSGKHSEGMTMRTVIADKPKR